MFAVRPVFRHYLLWLMLAPVFLIEAYTLHLFVQTLALNDADRTATATAQVEDVRPGASGTEVRYRFSVVGRPESFFPTDLLGQTNRWIPIDAPTAARAMRSGTVEVRYLPENPWVHRATGRLGSPLADSFFTWGLILLVDVVWVAETLIILRNYAYAQASAERQQVAQFRFWRTIRTR